MKVSKQIQEIFDSQARECAKLVKELAAHDATWPAVKTEYDEVDGACITLAASLNAAKTAGSPTAFAIEAELKKLRWKRDGIAAAFRRKRDKLHAAIEAFTSPLIQDFHCSALERIKGLSKLYLFERDEPVFDIFSDRKTVTIRHNGAALDSAKIQIFAAIKEIQNMRHAAVSDLREKIEKYNDQFADFDYSTMEIANVSESVARDMQPAKPDSAPPQLGMQMPDGIIHLFAPPADATRIDSLSARLFKLEKTQ
jgi:hypothetical protein